MIGLSPMAGFTDPAYRTIAGKMGADACITEMISADGLIRGKQDETLIVPKGSPKTIVQMFGYDAKIMLKGAEILEKMSFPEININAGCPVRKVIKKGAGGGLLKNLDNLKNIIETLSSTIKKPISVKIRTGFVSHSEALNIAKTIEKAGALSIIVHGRTVKQLYSGKADWDIIKKIKDTVNIPVFGNGDIFTWQDAYKRLMETNVDGIYIGRGALSNPYIFEEIKERKTIEYTRHMALKWLKEYSKLREKYKIKSGSFKAVAMSAMKGFNGAKELRTKIALTKKYEEIEDIFDVNTFTV